MMRRPTPTLLLLILAASCTTTGATPTRYYWAQVTQGTAVLDIIQLPDGQSERVGNWAQTLGMNQETWAGEQICIPENEAIPPEMLPRGTQVSLLTDAGPTTHTVTGHCAGWGAGETHWFVFLEPKTPSLEPAGFLAGSGGNFPANARLKAPPEADLSLPENQAVIKSLLPLLCQPPIPELAVERCKDLTITKESVQLVRGHFGDGMTALVAFRWPIDETGVELYTAFFAIDESTQKTVALVPPGQGINYILTELTGDIDGDGQDEAVVIDAYYEGMYYELLDWINEKPTLETLTGDGA